MRILIILFIISAVHTCAFAQQETFSYDDHGKRDPFWRLVNSSGVIVNYDKDLSISDMILEGIIFNPDGNGLAIVNGKIIKKGDKIGFYKVLRVESDKVMLRKGEETFVLKLKKEEQ